MCYSIYLSTDCPVDLEQAPYKHLHFFEDFEPEPAHEPLLILLANPRRWYLNRQEYGGCSCHFRHSMEDHSFEPLQEWEQEDEDNILATKEAYHAFRKIIQDGYQLDLINVWSGVSSPEHIKSLDVHLDSIHEDSFRFFEGHRFIFSI